MNVFALLFTIEAIGKGAIEIEDPISKFKIDDVYQINLDSVGHFVERWNPDLASRRIQLARSESLVGFESRYPNPLVQPRISRNTQTREHNLGLIINQEIPTRGKRSLKNSIELLKIESIQAEIENLTHQLKLKATQALIELGFLKLDEKYLVQQIDKLSELLATKKTLAARGEDTSISIAQLEFQITNLEFQHINHKEEEKITHFELLNLLGTIHPHSVNIVPPDVQDWHLSQLDKSEGTLSSFHPELVIKKSALEIATISYRLEKLQNVQNPTLIFGVESGIEEDLPIGFVRESTFSLGVSMPLPIWSNNSKLIRAKLWDKQHAEVALKHKENQLNRRILFLKSMITMNFSLYDQLQKNTLPAAKQRLQMLNNFQEQGQGSIDFIVKAETDFHLMRLKEMETRKKIILDLIELEYHFSPKPQINIKSLFHRDH